MKERLVGMKLKAITKEEAETKGVQYVGYYVLKMRKHNLPEPDLFLVECENKNIKLLRQIQSIQESILPEEKTLKRRDKRG